MTNTSDSTPAAADPPPQTYPKFRETPCPACGFRHVGHYFADWCERCTRAARRGTLADRLALWAAKHAPAAFAALAASDAPEWEARVLANVVRARAALADGRAWLECVACDDAYGPELRRLAPHVKRAGGYPIDPAGGMTFAEWVDAIRALNGCPALADDEPEVRRW